MTHILFILPRSTKYSKHFVLFCWDTQSYWLWGTPLLRVLQSHVAPIIRLAIERPLYIATLQLCISREERLHCVETASCFKSEYSLQLRCECYSIKAPLRVSVRLWMRWFFWGYISCADNGLMMIATGGHCWPGEWWLLTVIYFNYNQGSHFITFI